jgi:mono/diheme cytochrome c family protein
MRNGKTLLHRICVPIALAVVMSCSASYVRAAEKSVAGTVRAADVIHIDAAAQFRALENSKVAFRHDVHTRALASQGKDCSACHMSKDGKMSTKFMRLEDKSADSLKTLYHTNCVSCHVAVGKADKAGRKTGPMEGEGTRCHDVGGRYVSSRQAFA